MTKKHFEKLAKELARLYLKYPTQRTGILNALDVVKKVCGDCNELFDPMTFEERFDTYRKSMKL